MFFKKKQIAHYRVFLHSIHKFKWIANELMSVQPDDLTILIYFFEKTADKMGKLLRAADIPYQNSSGDTLPSEGIHLIDARSLKGMSLPKAEHVMALEVHPIKSINEIPLIAGQKNNAKNTVYYSGVDEAVMKAFGGERLQNLMMRMGVDEEKPIEHSMVDKSIERATKKVEEKTPHHQDVRSSQEDWVSANLG